MAKLTFQAGWPAAPAGIYLVCPVCLAHYLKGGLSPIGLPEASVCPVGPTGAVVLLGFPYGCPSWFNILQVGVLGYSGGEGAVGDQAGRQERPRPRLVPPAFCLNSSFISHTIIIPVKLGTVGAVVLNNGFVLVAAL